MSEPNGVMMQFFHWYTPPDGNLWNELAEKAQNLAKVGITSVWLPPAYKGTGEWGRVFYSFLMKFCVLAANEV
ncbi:MAG: hypothetical protein QNJ63_07505 [Calothrix sp. MO_192.B10]|nr:hypothetical protein [Calothrix sp. MO_192.B10]